MIGEKEPKISGDILIIVISSILITIFLVWQGFSLKGFSTSFIGGNFDTKLNSWALFQSFENLLNWPIDLGYAPIFYGDPSPLFSTIAPYGIAIFFLPIYLFLKGNIYLVYNLYFISTFILTSWVGYRLIKYLIKPKIQISIFAGILLGFAQYRYMHIPHIETLSTQFLLISIFCLHRFIDSNKLSWGLATSISFFFTISSSGYLGMIFIVIAFIFGLSILIKLKYIPKDLLINSLIAIALLGLLLLPFAVARLENSPGFLVREMVNFKNSAKPFDWLSGSSQLYFGIIKSSGGGNKLFIGLIPLGLSLLYIFSKKNNLVSRKNTIFSISEVVGIYIFISILGYLFTLGPTIELFNIEVTLPYSLFQTLPGFNQLRAINRFIFLPIIGSVIIASHYLSNISIKFHNNKIKFLVNLILILGLIEIIPYSGVNISNIQDVFSENRPTRMNNLIIDGEKPIFTWLNNLPPGTPHFNYPNRLSGEYLNRNRSASANTEYIADLFFHNQPMLNGWGSIIPGWFKEIDWETFPSFEINSLLINRNIEYILIHRYLMLPSELEVFDIRMEECERLCENFEFLERIGDVDVYKTGK